MKIIEVPEEFRPDFPFRTPPHQIGMRIEKYAYNYFIKNEVNTDYAYLPVFWSPYHVNHGYGTTGQEQLRNLVVKSIEQNKKVFTICEYADGTLMKDLNILAFNAACLEGVPLPLLSDLHDIKTNANPTLLASFIGNIGRHEIRKKMVTYLKDKDGIYIGGEEGINPFELLMSISWFALCPRGYGVTSFRLYEAIQIGCIPVYIYDEPHLPFNEELKWHEFCILVHETDLPKLESRLRSYSTEQKNKMRTRLAEVLKTHFNMESTCNYVKKYLETRMK